MRIRVKLEETCLTVTFSPVAILPGNIILHCPPLTSTRPYPGIIAHHRPVKTADVAAASEARELLLPEAVVVDGPYAYGTATDIIACPDDDRYFYAFFPKLDQATTRRLQLQAASSVLSDGIGPSRPANLDTSMHDDGEDLGGVIAVYRNLDVIQQPGPKGNGQATYIASFPLEFALQAFWMTRSSPIAWRWLHSSRRWAFSEDQREKDKLIRLPARGPTSPFNAIPLFGEARHPPHAPTLLMLLSDGALRLHYPAGVALPSAATWTEAMPIGMLQVETSRQSSMPTAKSEGQAQPVDNPAHRPRIRRGQGDIHLRPNDPRIFVAYQSSASTQRSLGDGPGLEAAADITIGLGISNAPTMASSGEPHSEFEPSAVDHEAEECIRMYEVDCSWTANGPSESCTRRVFERHLQCRQLCLFIPYGSFAIPLRIRQCWH